MGIEYINSLHRSPSSNGVSVESLRDQGTRLKNSLFGCDKVRSQIVKELFVALIEVAYD